MIRVTFGSFKPTKIVRFRRFKGGSQNNAFDPGKKKLSSSLIVPADIFYGKKLQIE